MEQLLNSVWLVFSLAALAVWMFAHRRATPKHGPRFLVGAVTIACALVLLFPAISATDDLHGMQMLQEDGAITKVRCQLASVTLTAGSAVFINHLPVLTSRPLWHVWGQLGPEASPFVSDLAPLPVSGRAPPIV